MALVSQKVLLIGLACAALAGAGAVAFMAGGADHKAEHKYDMIDSGDAQLVAQGRKVYMKECASCHGKSGKGQANWQQRQPDGLLPAPPHDETGHTWHHPDGLLFRLVKNGVGALVSPNYVSSMIPYKDRLSDRDIAASIAYIKSRWPKRIRDHQGKTTQSAIAAQAK
ncbi:MAG: c-type cytochrome [Alphaproteobacteria bacterium]|jgi:mono/diheme cytochrome c family protein